VKQATLAPRMKSRDERPASRRRNRHCVKHKQLTRTWA